MPASSDTIAQLAAALAKAQMELINPAKTQIAVLDGGPRGAGGKCFRYAPLSAGLDIVRKTLGKHEIAVIQTTDIEAEGPTLVLTTTLAHSSGEWISARWPVCKSSDLSNPQLMGAGLTYARRYGLFTMAGLAGEDDIDAGGLAQPEPRGGDAEDLTGWLARVRSEMADADTAFAEDPVLMGPADGEVHDRSGRIRSGRGASNPHPVKPGSIGSSDDLMQDLARAADADALLQWALEALPFRNGLDAKRRATLDAAFLARADAIGVAPELLLPFHLDHTHGADGTSAAVPA